jgi:asparagine N-glycosylation enzyme membrane subunit Stt3
MRLFLPKQHGAWAMLIIPFWLGVVATSLVWQHIPFFLGWILLYLATYPILLLFKRKKLKYYSKWAVIYMVPALILLAIPIWYQPKIVFFGFLMIPFFAINAYYSRKNQDRSMGNDISAVIVFSLAGIGSGFFISEQVTTGLLLVFVSSVLFFLGSTFYVKSMIREKKNKPFKWLSWIYHFLIPIFWIAFGEWMVCIAFLPSLIRAIYFYGKPLSAKQVGIYEIVNASLFFIFVLWRLI